MKKFNNDVKKRLTVLPTPETIEATKNKHRVQERLKHFVFTVDNEDTRAYDDAVSIVSTLLIMKIHGIMMMQLALYLLILVTLLVFTLLM